MAVESLSVSHYCLLSQSFQYFNPKFIAPMRYFSRDDMESNGSKELVYSSSRLIYEDIQLGRKSAENLKEGLQKSDEDHIENDSLPPSQRNPEKMIPSFFSRTYVSWSLLAEKMNVHTPVCDHILTLNWFRVLLYFLISLMCRQFKKLFTKS